MKHDFSIFFAPLKRSLRSAHSAVRPQKDPVMMVKTKRKPEISQIERYHMIRSMILSYTESNIPNSYAMFGSFWGQSGGKKKKTKAEGTQGVLGSLGQKAAFGLIHLWPPKCRWFFAYEEVVETQNVHLNQETQSNGACKKRQNRLSFNFFSLSAEATSTH